MMQGRQVFGFAGRPVAERFDRVIEILLIVLLAFGPVAFGVVHAWSELVVVLLAAAISLAFLTKLVFTPGALLVWSWVYIPVGAFLLIVVLQLTPLPSSVVRAISPNTVATKMELLADLPDSDQLLSSTTLSFYPNATRHDLRLVLAVAAVLVVVINVYRQPRRIKRLLTAIAAIGGTIALLALAQTVVGNGRIYWFVPTYDKANSGTFINHSHYGQFMNLSMGAVLGLLLITLHDAFDGGRATPATVAEYLSSPEGRMAKGLIAILVLGAVTVFLSLTRGGMISMLIAAAFTTLMLSWRHSLKGSGWIMVLLALGASSASSISVSTRYMTVLRHCGTSMGLNPVAGRSSGTLLWPGRSSLCSGWAWVLMRWSTPCLTARRWRNWRCTRKTNTPRPRKRPVWPVFWPWAVLRSWCGHDTAETSAALRLRFAWHPMVWDSDCLPS